MKIYEIFFLNFFEEGKSHVENILVS